MKPLYLIFTFCFLWFSTEGIAQNTKPQEPIPPFQYSSEEVNFKNIKADNITLSGTLTLPKNKKKPAVVVLIAGSGPQNRNSEILGHKPFLVISDYLTNNDIAVLRFDERGIEKSEGNHKTATTFDLASDVNAAVEYLKTRTDINTSKIGLIGHSEGGLIAPIVASKNKTVAFIVLLAGPGVNGQEVLQSQSKKIAELSGTTQEGIAFNNNLTSVAYEVIKTEKDTSKLKTNITKALENYKSELESENSPFAIYVNEFTIKQLTNQLTNPWMLSFLKIEPQHYLSQVKCPVLAINGTKDLQVLPDLNLNAIESALKKGNNNAITIIQLEGLNHLFQKSETGLPQEYAGLEDTFNIDALMVIKNWILEQI
ncbi:alpha/beta hydrolase family protein [Lacinutrix salivirga]